MHNDRVNYLAVGAFVLVLTAGFVVAVAVLLGRTGAMDGYHTVYDNVGGVRSGTQVFFEGYPVGSVTKVAPERDDGVTQFRVDMDLESGFPIPKDSRAVVTSAGLLAGVNIEIRRGEAREHLEPGSMIRPGPSADIFSAVARLAGQMEQLGEAGLEPLIERIGVYIDELGETMVQRAPDLADNLDAITQALAVETPQISRNLAEVTRRLDEEMLSEGNIERIVRMLDNLEQASATLNEDVLGADNRQAFNATLGNMQASSQDFALLAQELRESRERLDNFVATLDEMSDENREPINRSVSDLRYTLDAVARHIDSVTYNLESTSRNMNEFTRQVRQDPSLLLRGGQREPER